ncbi:hypothetical protein JTE90_015140 [Oedothorax gibbosus]|uniref:Uncharacterized protein n=1 Tax=Oedothorax gibbosus TaxID=931172 RepID=A0AAV6VT32_9ARAC|nr:hypothetical protein JTE90_015140 [Oedothorax gibbosus]
MEKTNDTDEEQYKSSRLQTYNENNLSKNRKLLSFFDVEINSFNQTDPFNEKRQKTEALNQDVKDYPMNDLYNSRYNKDLQTKKPYEDSPNYETSSIINNKDIQTFNFKPVHSKYHSKPNSGQIFNKKSAQEEKGYDRQKIRNRKPKLVKRTYNISADDKNLVAPRNVLKDNKGTFQINDPRLDENKTNKISGSFNSMVKSKPEIGNQLNLYLKSVKINETRMTKLNYQMDQSKMFGDHYAPYKMGNTKMDSICASIASVIISHPLIVGMALALFLIFLILLLICMYCLGKRSVKKSTDYSELDLNEKGMLKNDTNTDHLKLIRNSLRADSCKRFFSIGDTSSNESENFKHEASEPLKSLKENKIIHLHDSISEMKQNETESNIFEWIDSKYGFTRPTDKSASHSSSATTSVDERQLILDKHIKDKNLENQDSAEIISNGQESSEDTLPKFINSLVKSAQGIASYKKYYDHISAIPKEEKINADGKTQEFLTPNNQTYSKRDTGEQGKDSIVCGKQLKQLLEHANTNSSNTTSLDRTPKSYEQLDSKTYAKETKFGKKHRESKYMRSKIPLITPESDSLSTSSKYGANDENIKRLNAKEIVNDKKYSLVKDNHPKSQSTKLANIKYKKKRSRQTPVEDQNKNCFNSSKRTHSDCSKSVKDNSSSEFLGIPLLEELTAKQRLHKSQTTSKHKKESKPNIFHRLYQRVQGKSPREVSSKLTHKETSSTTNSCSYNISPARNFRASFLKDKRLSKKDKIASSSSELISILNKEEWSSKENVKNKNETLVQRIVKPENCSKIDDMLTGDKWERLTYRNNSIGSHTNGSIRHYDSNTSTTKKTSDGEYSSNFLKDNASNHSLQDEIEESIRHAELHSIPFKPLMKHELQKESTCKLLFL